MSDQDSNPKQTGSTPHACKHPFVWPNGDCVRCEVFVTTLPAHTEPTHTMLPRKFTPLIATLAEENAQLRKALQEISSLWPEPPHCAPVNPEWIGPNDGKMRAILLETALKISRAALEQK